MAIIKIPSKKIYDNPKHGLSKNYINKVEAKEHKLDFEKDFDAVIGTTREDLTNKGFGYHSGSALDKGSSTGSSASYAHSLFVELYTFGTSAEYPIVSDDGKKRITRLSQDQRGVSISATKITREYSLITLDGDELYYTNERQNPPPTESEVINAGFSPSSITEEDVDFVPHEFGFGWDPIANEYRQISYDFGDHEIFSVSMGEDKIEANATNRRVKAFASYGQAMPMTSNKVEWTFVEFVEYIPKELTFSVYGDTEEYKDASNNRSYGIGNDYFKMSTNELVQETAEIDGVPVVEANANAIISEYKNGKETYELLCSIGEYYDNDGVVSVSVNDNAIPYISYDLSGDIKVYTKKDIGIFNIGNLVVPYKPSASGDVPISFKSDGKTPKIFRVVGVTPIFDGAVWQLLNLLETNLEEQRFATAYVGAVPHTSTALLKPIRFYSYVENTYNLGDEVKEVYYRGKKLPEEYANGDSTNVEYYNASEIAYHYAYFKDGVLTIRTVSSTDNISGSLTNWNGVTPEVQPTTLTFELKKS